MNPDAPRARGFVAGESLPLSNFEEITDLRVARSRVVEQEARKRRRRTRLTGDGRLVLVALDHPARGITRILTDLAFILVSFRK